MAIGSLCRRHSAVLLALLVTMAFASPGAAQQMTEWGWPQPYEKVSDKSVAWLKEKGWWPMTVAFQPPWSGQSTVNIVMDRKAKGFVGHIIHGLFQVTDGRFLAARTKRMLANLRG